MSNDDARTEASTRVVADPVDVRAACEHARRQGRRVALVPTMGALHRGHLALIEAARACGADFVVVSVFVNPLQFGPNEDFARYPRTFGEDLEQCRALHVDIVFAPDVEHMYPRGFQTHVEVARLTEKLEGERRPGHFRGVTTIVTKLFNTCAPCIAIFGRKDYQQWKVIERMVADLHIPVEVVGHPTVRDSDGLALSSRNRYLSAEERARGLSLVRGLRSASISFAQGERNASTIERLVRESMQGSFDHIDYVMVADPESLDTLTGTLPSRVLLAVAAKVGATRLIDNVVLGEETF